MHNTFCTNIGLLLEWVGRNLLELDEVHGAEAVIALSDTSSTKPAFIPRLLAQFTPYCRAGDGWMLMKPLYVAADTGDQWSLMTMAEK